MPIRGRLTTMNVLFVSIAFPPKQDPEGIQAGKYLRYLSLVEDISIDVVTSASPTINMPFDRSLEEYDKGYRQKIEIRLREKKWLTRIKRLLYPSSLIPDSKNGFATAVPTVIAKLSQAPDVVYARTFPPSSALLARRIAEHYSVPWVLHLSDPWASTGAPHAQWKLEEDHIKSARFVTMTTDLTISLYQARYPEFADKFVLLPNVYDPEKRIVRQKNGTTFKLVYTGGMAGHRNPRPILDLADKLVATYPHIVDKLEIVLAGDADRNSRQMLKASRHRFLRWIGQVPLHEALKLQASADLLISLDAPKRVPEDLVYLPSKIIDYFSLEIPILAFTNQGSQTSLVLNEISYPWFKHDQSENAAAFVAEQLEKPTLPTDFQPNFYSRYNAVDNSRELARVLKRAGQTKP